MRRIDLNVEKVTALEGFVMIHGNVANSNELIEITIPVEQMPAITGVLEVEEPMIPDEEETKPKKKGGK